MSKPTMTELSRDVEAQHKRLDELIDEQKDLRRWHTILFERQKEIEDDGDRIRKMESQFVDLVAKNYERYKEFAGRLDDLCKVKATAADLEHRVAFIEDNMVEVPPRPDRDPGPLIPEGADYIYGEEKKPEVLQTYDGPKDKMGQIQAQGYSKFIVEHWLEVIYSMQEFLDSIQGRSHAVKGVHEEIKKRLNRLALSFQLTIKEFEMKEKNDST